MRILWRGRVNREHWRGWRERFGLYDTAPVGREVIWVHAVSVGESTAAVPLVRGLRERFPQLDIVVTTTTLTGAQTVGRLLGDIVTHVYFPYDLPWILRRFLAQFPVRLLVILETELWPNTLRLCEARAIPAVLVNARLSERSLSAYQRAAPLIRRMVRSLRFIAAQSSADADRFRALGADDGQVCISGSLKFDLDLPASLHEQAEAVRRSLGINRPVLMLGSTREGEEAILLEALRVLKPRFGELLVVLAPRHPERFDAVADACAAAGFRVTRRSAGSACGPATDVYLLDTMGELPRFYAAADVAFVGGSLLPYGGHNVLEPAAMGTPVISGPHTHNFTEICGLLAAGGVLRVAADADAFAAHVADWLGDSNERDRIGQIGREIVRTHRGASARTLDLLAQALAPH